MGSHPSSWTCHDCGTTVPITWVPVPWEWLPKNLAETHTVNPNPDMEWYEGSDLVSEFGRTKSDVYIRGEEKEWRAAVLDLYEHAPRAIDLPKKLAKLRKRFL